MPRKSQPVAVESSMYLKIITWIKSKPIYALVVLLSIISLILIITLQKSSTKNNAVDVQQQVVSTISPSNALEIQIEKQNVIIQKLETQNAILDSNIKMLEKRHQAHTDVMKRICEYIVVITVDKKIIPRQCLYDYGWRKEEGN